MLELLFLAVIIAVPLSLLLTVIVVWHAASASYRRARDGSR